MNIFKGKNKFKILGILMASLMLLGCTQNPSPDKSINKEIYEEPSIVEEVEVEKEKEEKPVVKEEVKVEEKKDKKQPIKEEKVGIDLSNIPVYNGKPFVAINNNVPFFTEKDLTTNSFETYSPLDTLGRCSVAYANIGRDIMPVGERGPIGSIKPSGWHSVRYQGIDGNYLYNRCHLIGFQLSGENANSRNLITGTRYLNIEGMLPFENMVADYIKATNNHVLYRVTPIFEGNNLVASGVLLEGKSVEDNGLEILFNVYCYNVQPGIEINYATGESKGPEYTGTTVTHNTTKNSNNNINSKYILNTNTKKIHRPECSSVGKMSEKNKQNYNGNIEDIIQKGYSPCKICNP